MPFATAGEESTTASCRTPRQTGWQTLAPHPRAAYANRNGGLSSLAAREAIITKPLLTAGVLVMTPPPGVAVQSGSHEPPTGPPQPAALNTDRLPRKFCASEPSSAT